MVFSKCFINRYDNNFSLISRRVLDPIDVIVRREGSRMVDNAEIELSGKNDIKNGDYIGYLQDNIDLSGLIGLWNFAGCVRDESGNDLHQEGAYTGIPTDTPVSYPKQTSISKLYGKRSCYMVGIKIGRAHV